MKIIFLQPSAPPAAPTNTRGRRSHIEQTGPGSEVEREGRPGDCNGSAVLCPKADGGRSKERMWGGKIPILATECTEDTEKFKNALCTQRPLQLKTSHKLYIFTAMTPAGSTNQCPRPPPAYRAVERNRVNGDTFH